MPLCMGCLNEIPNDGAKCTQCGFDNSKEQIAPFLPYGTILQSKYVVAKNLDTNGESTRYLGYDNSTGRVVSIREFLPIGLFDRKKGDAKVTILSDCEDKYIKAFNDFENYYKILMPLSDKAPMVNILDVFDANNSCYVIEDCEELISFSEYVENNGGTLDWDDVRPLFMPIITLLETLHKNDIGHYAVSTSNLFVTVDGKLKLSGFSTENERKRGTMLKSQLYSGCAAPEQYRNNYKLSTATDIYGLTAVLFYTLTGKLPNNAKDRVNDPGLKVSTSTVKKIPHHVVSALANGLQMNLDDRIDTFDELRSQLSVSSTVQVIQDEISKTASMTPIKQSDLKKHKNKKSNTTGIAIVATIVALLLFSSLGLYWLSSNPLNGVFTKPSFEVTLPPTEEGWTGPVFSNYVGMHYVDLLSAIEKEGNGIKVKIDADGAFSDKDEKGVIISQEPKPGTAITANEPIVYVVLSKGPQMVKLPEASKKSVGSVTEKLTELGFVVLQELDYSDTIKADYVIDYVNYKSGDKVESGSEITLKVSRGEKPEETETQ